VGTRLVPIKPGSVPSIPVQRPVVLVGRHPECDVRINLSKVSRRHCCLALAYDRVLIRDLGSRNGVRVNGAVVDEAQLHPGDTVAIGPLLFRVEDPDAAAQPALAAAPGRSAPPLRPAPPEPEPQPRPADELQDLPFLPLDPHDPDGDLLPLDIDF
jgi:predicted component of type VI protein secretion system